MLAEVLCCWSPLGCLSARARLLTFLLCEVKTEDFEEGVVTFDFVGAKEVVDLAEEIRLERLLEKPSDDEEEIGLCLCLEASRVPYREGAIVDGNECFSRRLQMIAPD